LLKILIFWGNFFWNEGVRLRRMGRWRIGPRVSRSRWRRNGCRCRCRWWWERNREWIEKRALWELRGEMDWGGFGRRRWLLGSIGCHASPDCTFLLLFSFESLSTQNVRLIWRSNCNLTGWRLYLDNFLKDTYI